MLNSDQKHQLNKLLDHRDSIENSIYQISRILKEYFPKEYEIAYQHWIPQITTALNEHEVWLPRGQYNMQQTIKRLLDESSQNKISGVSKYI